MLYIPDGLQGPNTTKPCRELEGCGTRVGYDWDDPELEKLFINNLKVFIYSFFKKQVLEMLFLNQVFIFLINLKKFHVKQIQGI